jgi:hypothetical protein
MKKTGILLMLAGLLFAAQTVSAQKSRSNARTDSLNNSILKEYSKKIVEAEQLRIADSIKKTELEAQFNSLKTTDNLKKEELQKQLQDLKDKETNRLAKKKLQIDSLRHTAKAFPVYGFFKDTLFSIYSKQGIFSAKQRAEAISSRINQLADVFGFASDSLKIIELETTIDIVNGETIIMSISENDAIWNNSSKMGLAEMYRALSHWQKRSDLPYWF